MKGVPFTVRPLVLDIVRGYPAGASSTDVLAELQEQGVETTIDSVCHALSAATAAGEGGMMTDPWKVDPRLDGDPRGQAPRLLRPAERPPTCSCGCRSLHEVARRRLVDGGMLVVLSDGAFRLWRPRALVPDVWWLDRLADDVRRVLDWSSVYDSDTVAAQLDVLAGGAA